MARPLLLSALAISTLLANLPAQTPPTPPAIQAELLAASNRSWQCDPIRCSLRVTNKGSDAQLRPKYSTTRSPLFPIEVERERNQAWQPIESSQPRRSHPSRYLTAPSGRKLDRDATYTFEVDLWDLDAVSEPGRILIRFALEVRDPAHKDTAWTDLQTPWLEIEIRAHAANAACLLPKDASDLRARYDRLSNALNSTLQTARNTGPTNPGPAGPATARRWQPHASAAAQLLAGESLSSRLRARARLVLAYDAIEQAMRADGDAAEEHLRAAGAHLDAVELAASPPSGGLAPLPSGGLEPLRRMLVAYVDARQHGKDLHDTHAALRREYPFFGEWWRHELAQLLLE